MAITGSEQRFYMADLEKRLGRTRSTIRTWEDKCWLPAGCEFQRDDNGWRYWTLDQVQIVESWMSEMNQGRVNAGLRRSE